MRARLLLAGLFAATVLGVACGGGYDDVTGTANGQGTLAVHLKDHPFFLDSVAAVNIFVVRIDARVAVADSAECDSLEDHDGGSLLAADHDGDTSHVEGDSARDDHDEFEHERRWVTIAEPDTTFNLLDLRNGVTAFLGEAAIDTGNFRALRIVIDPSRSSIVLKNGTVLSGAASPFARFPSGARVGIKIFLTDGIHVREHHRTVVVVDFDLEHSFVLLGEGMRDGILFKPVLRVGS